MTTPQPPKLRSASRFVRWAGFGLLAVLVATVGAGIIYQLLATQADRRNLPPPGQLVDVGGFDLHLYCTGSGSPTVILETLSGGSSVNWGWIQPEVARAVRVCSYDRAGFGWSEADPQPESLERTARNLHALLENAHVPGPYVLVGHSIGGLYAREYAAQYPDQVAGLVLIDASHPEQFERHPELLAADKAFRQQVVAFPWLARLGLFHFFFATGGEIDFQDLPSRQHDELVAFWSAPTHWVSQRRAIDAAPQIFDRAQALGDLGSLPLAVISAGKSTPSGWAELQDELAALSTVSTHVTLPEATHASLAFDPDHAHQVSAALLDLVQATCASDEQDHKTGVDTPAADARTPAPVPPALGSTLGAKIAFQTDRDGNWEIYTMNSDGSDPINVSRHGANDSRPAWSPEGTRIAFGSDRDGNGEIYVMYADGSQVTRLTENREDDMMPAWSPDGTQIAFATRRDGGLSLYVMNVDGSKQRRLADLFTVGGDSAWSPDGTRVAFSVLEQHYVGRIYVVNADGSGLTPLTPYGTYRVSGPAWSPDGSRIVFASEKGHHLKTDLYLMNADGSGETRLTEDWERAWSPSWSPDGSQIAFVVTVEDGNDEIYCMNVDGSNVRSLTDHQADDRAPAWSPVTAASER